MRWATGSARSSQFRRASEGHGVQRRLPREGPRTGWEAWGAGGRIFGLVCVVGGRISVWHVCAVARTLMGSQRRAGVAVWAVTPPACSDLKKSISCVLNVSSVNTCNTPALYSDISQKGGIVYFERPPEHSGTASDGRASAMPFAARPSCPCPQFPRCRIAASSLAILDISLFGSS